MEKTRHGNGVELKRGPWTPEEDRKLFSYIEKNGHRNWSTLAQKAGLQRCGKSCRIRWINYLRPDIKRGKFTSSEEQTIIQLHALLGNRWSLIAAFLPNRTDNEIKNYWNCRLKKQLAKMGIDPSTHRRKTTHSISLNNNEPKNAAKIIHMAQWESTRLEAEARLVKKSKFENKQLNSLVESEIISNLKAMPHLYLCSFDQPYEEIAASKPPLMPPCLDILKAWEIAADDSVSLDADYYNNSSMNDSNLESITSGYIAENLVATNETIFNDIWAAVDPIDMGSLQTSFDDFGDLLLCNSDEGNLLKNEGFFSTDGGRRPGEELLGFNLSYCGRVGSLLMH